MCCYAQALLLQGHVGASVTLDQVCEMCTFHYFTRRGKEMYISRSVEGPVPTESSGPLPVWAMRRRLPRPIQNAKADSFAVSQQAAAAVSHQVCCGGRSPTVQAAANARADRCRRRVVPGQTILAGGRPQAARSAVSLEGTHGVCLDAALALLMIARPMPTTDRWLYARARPHG